MGLTYCFGCCALICLADTLSLDIAFYGAWVIGFRIHFRVDLIVSWLFVVASVFVWFVLLLCVVDYIGCFA